jgi:SAM-dependent methyltransferase
VASYEQLAAEAAAAPFAGWDFSWLDARTTTEPLPWSYRAEVARHAAGASAMLDLGTGGGEWLARLDPRPARTVATEAWPPNVPVAAQRLRPAGIAVVQDEGAPDNAPGHPAATPGRGRLPFGGAAFDLVIDRHEAFLAAEVHRILVPGGTFVTQQVDTRSSDDLYRLLGLAPPAQPASWLPMACQELEEAGFAIRIAQAGEERQYFHDVAGIIYYLRAVGWSVPEFTLDRFAGRLRRLHEDPGAWPLVNRHRRFLIVAARAP